MVIFNDEDITGDEGPIVAHLSLEDLLRSFHGRTPCEQYQRLLKYHAFSHSKGVMWVENAISYGIDSVFSYVDEVLHCPRDERQIRTRTREIVSLDVTYALQKLKKIKESYDLATRQVGSEEDTSTKFLTTAEFNTIVDKKDHCRDVLLILARRLGYLAGNTELSTEAFALDFEDYKDYRRGGQRPEPEFETELTKRKIVELNHNGHSALERGMLDYARNCFMKVLTFDPHNTYALSTLAYVFKGKQQHIPEELSIEKLDATKSQTFTDLGLLAREAQDFSCAEYFFKRAVNLDPNDIPANYYRGVVLFQTRDFSEAARYFETVITLNNTLNRKHYPSHYLLALCYERMMYSSESCQHVKTALELHPEYQLEDYTTAEEHKAAKRDYYAIDHYQRATLFNSNNLPLLRKIADSLNEIGIRLKDQKKNADARAAFQSACDADSLLIHPYYHLGTIAMGERSWRDAELQFRHVLEIQPNHRYSHLQLGITLLTLKDYEEAEIHLQFAKQKDLSQAEPYLKQLGSIVKRTT